MKPTSIKSEGIVSAHLKGYIVDTTGDVYYKNNKLRPSIGYTGYKRIGVRFFSEILKRKTNKQIDVHRLVAFQKYKEAIFVPGTQVRHLNGNKLDNSSENIAIGSQQDNMLDIDPSTRRTIAIIAASHLRVADNETMKSIRADRANGFTYKELKEKYGLAKGTLSYMFNKACY